MSNEIELYSKISNPLDAINQVGEFLAKSGMFGCTKVEQGKVIAMTCMCDRITPTDFKRTYHLIDGPNGTELSMRADAMLAKFREKGGKHKVLCRTAEKAEVELSINGQALTFSLTFDEVKNEPFVVSDKDKSGLKKNWRTPRARMQMLWSRVISDGVRTMAPEIVAGVYTPDEIDDQDRPEKQLFTAAPAATAPAAPALPPAPEPKAIEVQAEVVSTPKSTPAPAAAEPAALSGTAVTTPATPAAAGQPGKVEKDARGMLSDETQKTIIAAVGEDNIEPMLAWFFAKNWLQQGQTLAHLSVDRANKILKNPAGFKKHIGI